MVDAIGRADRHCGWDWMGWRGGWRGGWRCSGGVAVVALRSAWRIGVSVGGRIGGVAVASAWLRRRGIGWGVALRWLQLAAANGFGMQWRRMGSGCGSGEWVRDAVASEKYREAAWRWQ